MLSSNLARRGSQEGQRSKEIERKNSHPRTSPEETQILGVETLLLLFSWEAPFWEKSNPQGHLAGEDCWPADLLVSWFPGFQASTCGRVWQFMDAMDDL